MQDGAGAALGRLNYRREIDGLRAVAVMAVVLYHAGVPLLGGGFTGVDIFFVISGYLITSLLLDEWRRHGRIDLTAFYARRVRRLLPALWLLIAVTLIASMMLFQPMSSQMHGVLGSAMAALSFVANIFFLRNSGGYFDGPGEEMPLLHLWSLSVEEQYYVVLPVALAVALRWRPRWWRAWLASAGVASFLLAEYWLRTSPSAAFFQMPARFWELALGGLIAGSSPGRLHFRWSATIIGAGLAMVLVAAFATGRQHFPGAGALCAVMGAGLVLYAVHGSAQLGVCGRLLASRPMVALGLISYSLYLWHWPLLAFDRALQVEPSPLGVRLALCALAVVLSWASYRFVETPFRRSAQQVSGIRVVMAGAASSLLLITAAWALQPTHSTSAADELVWATSQDQPANMSRCHLGLNDAVMELRVDACLSEPGRAPDVVIWGDSHALAWQPLAWEIAKSERLAAASFTYDSCPPVDGYSLYRADVPQHRDRCRQFNELVMHYLASHHVETLIMNGRWLVHFAQDTAISSGLEKVLSLVSGRVGRVILIAPSPELRDSAPKCISNGDLAGCAVPRAEYERSAGSARRILQVLAAKYPNVTVIDPANFFCNAGECPVMKDGYALFWDDDHVSATAARAFAHRYLQAPDAWTLPGVDRRHGMEGNAGEIPAFQGSVTR